ncbi:MAG: glycosyltransferase family 10 [Desulfuromusa sp.]
MDRSYKKIKVKFCTLNVPLWLRQFPAGVSVWGNCEFIFDPSSRDYDWFVVYNDLPVPHVEEILSCPQQNTLLVTTEPPSIKSYGNDFTRQFGCVLTSQPEWALPHGDRIFSQPALQWFYGWGTERLRTYDDILSTAPVGKTKDISTVCSNKKQRHTLHNKRYQFTQDLKQKLPELDIFGHGVRDMADKAEALDAYRYHIAIENYIGEHHWTEKLADPFLGLNLPFYFGCPNAADYFPEESFIPIDIYDLDRAHEIIQRSIRDNEYQRRLPYIIEARRLVLEKYNLFAVLSREIETRHGVQNSSPSGAVVASRRQLRKSHPAVAVRDVIEKSRVRLRSIFVK